MTMFYKISAVIWIFVIYIAITVIAGIFVTRFFKSNEESVLLLGMYLGGLFAFVAFVIFTIDKFGLWA